MRKRDYGYILAILLLATFAFLQHRELGKLKSRPSHLAYDEPFIDQAVARWSQKVGRDRSDVLMNRYPVAVRFKDEVCIALQLERGSVGGTPVYCFSRQDRTLTREYSDVE